MQPLRLFPAFDQETNNMTNNDTKKQRRTVCRSSRPANAIWAHRSLLLVAFCLLALSNDNRNVAEASISSINATAPDRQLQHQNEDNSRKHSSIGSTPAKNPIAFEVVEPSREGERRNLFSEYLTRSMFSCGTKYVAVLQQLNKLMASAHQEYSQCQGQMATASQQSAQETAAQLEMISELFGDDDDSQSR